MSIKSDRWIRSMALEQRMIEPFVEGQVRQGVISYGLSSYGYDMRVADEFKVFTNVFNVLVDPKNFSQQSFVDIKADHCDIPPNSFALARSVEHFRIPRNVLSIVMGKSSYARCFRGDTRVALIDGTAPTLEEMAQQAEEGALFWGYSIGPHGRIIVTLLDKPRYIGRDALLEIVLDNGSVIHCTPDHEFMLRDGQMAPACSLKPDTALMPLYRDLFQGYEAVFQPLTGYFYPTHRLSDEWNIRNGIYADLPGTHRHHVDKAGSLREAARLLNCNRSVFRRFPEIVQAYSRQKKQVNHKIVDIREIPGNHDVYCLSVPEAGNFALESGVFVSNCGIVVNITPLEPAWEGFVTIEISNTTPLPARIYANEGIGQVLFFESDEACEISYADKKGKYQQQQGIVLPHIDPIP